MGDLLTACDSIDLELKKGETLGIVGESGCGKSTLLKLITQIERPNKGKLYIEGKDVTDLKGEALRRSRQHIQMVFQDPSSSFFPRMKVRDAISEPLRNFERLPRKEIDNRVKDLLELVQLPKDYISRYPHSMSGGQRQRLGIARALILEPDILVCDEATCALDVSVQKQIIELLIEIQRKRELSIIFVCHDLALIQSFSHRVMVMYLGNIVEVLPGNKVKDSAYHPYTKALLDSIFTVDMDPSKPIKLLEGEVPSSIDLPSGCPFHTRCSYKEEICSKEKPKLRELSRNHQIACHIIDI
ncbi:oligopeptide/dipeptide ABC transporter ATP-binding protein [Clostridium faecium]|nr:oligopeptide/dipeptide ABC transporter ATP-binding protein [Clostridium faecium]